MIFFSHEKPVAVQYKGNFTNSRIEKQLVIQIASKNEGVIPDIPKVKRKASGKHKVQFNLTADLKEILKVDVTEVFGINELSALTILSEVGCDMTKWKTEHHFTSWLGLAPNLRYKYIIA